MSVRASEAREAARTESQHCFAIRSRIVVLFGMLRGRVERVDERAEQRQLEQQRAQRNERGRDKPEQRDGPVGPAIAVHCHCWS